MKLSACGLTRNALLTLWAVASPDSSISGLFSKSRVPKLSVSPIGRAFPAGAFRTIGGGEDWRADVRRGENTRKRQGCRPFRRPDAPTRHADVRDLEKVCIVSICCLPVLLETNMVAIAQLVEHLIVVQKVARSSRVGHPTKTLPVSEGSFVFPSCYPFSSSRGSPIASLCTRPNEGAAYIVRIHMAKPSLCMRPHGYPAYIMRI